MNKERTMAKRFIRLSHNYSTAKFIVVCSKLSERHKPNIYGILLSLSPWRPRSMKMAQHSTISSLMETDLETSEFKSRQRPFYSKAHGSPPPPPPPPPPPKIPSKSTENFVKYLVQILLLSHTIVLKQGQGQPQFSNITVDHNESNQNCRPVLHHY